MQQTTLPNNKILNFIDTAMKDAFRSETPPSQNDPVLKLIERVVKRLESDQEPVFEPLPVFPSFEKRKLSLDELKAVSTLIGYQASVTGFPSDLIKLAVECRFDVDDLSHVSAAQFDNVVHYLVYFHESEVVS